jgi:hypothetical protein
MRKRSVTCLLVVLALIFCFSAHGFSGTLPVKAGDYPALSDKEIGHVRWMVKLAQQPPGDWSYMGGAEEGQEWLEAYRYQLAFMTYALALAQYHKTPAYRELYQAALDRFIQKMSRRDVWAFWAESSKGGKKFNPALNEKGQGWLDPVADKNIMYSGHLIHMVELYQMLYRDKKFDKPGSIAFTWEWLKEPLNTFQYDSPKLAQVIHKQFENNPWRSIECEVNLVFPMCNQHPVLGLMLYDHNHGTNLSAVKETVKKGFYEKKFVNPETRNWMYFYMVQQDKVVPVSSPGADGWTGAFMHAWDPKLIEGLYPFQTKKHVKWNPDGTAATPDDKEYGPVAGAAFFALLAKEMGDDKTAKGILAGIDKTYNPLWTDGMLRYPRNDEKKVTPWFTTLAATAEINVKNGIWTLHNEPWKDDHFAQPFISNVEYPKAIVKQAYYDKAKDILIVTVAAGVKGGGKTTFLVNQLDKGKNYSVRKNGKLVAQVKKGSVMPGKGAAGVRFDNDGRLKISTDLSRVQSFVVKSEG